MVRSFEHLLGPRAPDRVIGEALIALVLDDPLLALGRKHGMYSTLQH